MNDDNSLMRKGPRAPKGPNALEKYLTVKQAADLLGITVQAVSKAIHSGRLPAYELGEGKARRWILRKADVEAQGKKGEGDA